VLGADHPNVPVQYRDQPLLAAARPPQERAHQLCRLSRLVHPLRRRGARAPPLAPGRQRYKARGGGGGAGALARGRRVALRPWFRCARVREHRVGSKEG